MPKEYNIVGKKVPLIDGPQRVSGSKLFTADIHLPGKTLVGKCLPSPHAHARITSIDTSKAEALPGVRAVLTHLNSTQIPYSRYMVAFDGKVRLVGDDVAAVAADTEEIANEALGLIDVTYEVLPFTLTWEDASKAGAPLIYDSLIDNQSGGGTTRLWGDVAIGLNEADVIVECEGLYHPIHHATLEPRGVIAKWEFDQLTVWCGSQMPFTNRRSVANVMEMPISKVRIIQVAAGGTYGGRYASEPYMYIATQLARLAGGTVRMIYTRAEEFLRGPRKQRMSGVGKIGIKNDGTITALDCKFQYGVGCAGGNKRGHKVYATVYQYNPIPNLRCEAIGFHTNTTGCQSHRAVESKHESIVFETMMDMGAEAVNMDPIEFRRKNQIKAGDHAIYDQPAAKDCWCPSCGVGECMDKAAAMIGWNAKWKGWKTPVSVDGAKRRGIGMATYCYECGQSASNAIVKVLRDGTLHLKIGTADSGNNTPTSMAMIASEVLGLPFVNPRIPDYVDTDSEVDSAPSYASLQTFSTGQPTIKAALDAKRQILERAANSLDVQPEELDIKDGLVYVIGTDPAEGKGVGSFLVTEIIGRGFNQTSKCSPAESPWTGEILHPAYVTWTFGAAFVEVEVDTDTGEVKLLNYSYVADSGQPVNLASFLNQCYGGSIMGLDIAATEKLVWDPGTGALLNPNYLDYKHLTTLDIPEMTCGPTDTIDPAGPYGAKGLGEPPLIPSLPAVMNAVYNAIGVRMQEGPALHPDMVLKVLGKA